MVRLAFLSALLCLLGACPAAAADFDLVLRRGQIVNGTGKAAFVGDVAVKAGRIVAVGTFAGQGTTELDATGLVVAPGFIDVHTHGEDVLDRPLAENFCGWA